MASLEDDLEYLSPSFDPSSLTMPRLRNILMTHDIGCPASAKKPQLVDLFVQELKPKARKILAARERVRRTSRGITDMPSSQEGTVDGDLDDDASAMPPPPTPKQRKPRKSTRMLGAPDILEAQDNARVSNGRKGSSKHARQSDTETDQDTEPKRPSVRKSRKSAVTPRAKTQGAEDASARPPLRGGVFSDENPFQSGSSPLEFSENRRRTAGSNNDKRKSSASRRKTEATVSTSEKHSDGISPPISRTFEVSLSRLRQTASKAEPDDHVEAGEDFTPEEQLELVRERAAQGKRDILPPRQRRIKSPRSGAIPRSAPWVILTALVGGYATWWRQEKLAVGYCGIGRPSNALSNVQIPEWASVLQPNCELCPQHAICYEGMETRCEDDFVLQSHPLSLGGLIPLPPTCEPDGEKVRRVKAVADKAVEELRERNSQAECGILSDDTGKPISEEIVEHDLKKEVAKKRRRGMGDAEFDDLWKGAIGEIKGREEITVSGDE